MFQKPRVVIADSQELVAEAIEKLLASDCVIVGTVHDGRSLVEKIKVERPDIAVVDMSLPLLNGLDAGSQAKREQPSLKIVVVTTNESPEAVALAFKAGASAYVLKRSAGSELLKAIGEVMQQRRYVTTLIAEDVIDAVMHGHMFRETHLTSRQREVLQLLAEGKSMKEAAEILHIRTRTVAFHKHRLMEQLHLRNNAELIRFALKQYVV